MTEPLPEIEGPDGAGRGAPEPPRSAGALLKAAREREGLHVAVLAATIKVAPAKLQALEQDRYDELPNLTFARALAQSVCRSLKIDPRPVLALLPQVEALPLEGAMGRLNAPFQERPSRGDGAGLTWASKPMFWAGGLLLLAAVVVGMLPADLFDGMTPAPSAALPAASAPMPAASAVPQAGGPAASATASAPAATASAASPPASDAAPAAASAPANMPMAAPAVAAAPAPAPVAAVAAASAPASPPGAGLLGLRATGDSWIEVVDAQDRIVFSRVLRAGETATIDGLPPLRVRIGNAGGTSVTFRGQAVDLGPYTRVNVARLELR
jgi:cytoskeleton protein RodZ